MPTPTYSRPHLLPKLHDEILSTFPALKPTLHAEDAYGQRRVKTEQPLPNGATLDPNDPAYMLLPAENPDTLHLSWPDNAGVSEPQIAAIVNVHDPTPVPTQRSLDEEDLKTNYQAALDGLDQIISTGTNLTAAQVRDGLIFMARIQRRSLKIVRYLVGA